MTTKTNLPTRNPYQLKAKNSTKVRRTVPKAMAPHKTVATVGGIIMIITMTSQRTIMVQRKTTTTTGNMMTNLSTTKRTKITERETINMNLRIERMIEITKKREKLNLSLLNPITILMQHLKVP